MSFMRLLSWPWNRRMPRAGRRLIERLAGPLDGMLQVLVQDSAAGVAVVDRHGRLVRVNEALRRMVECNCDLFPGQPAQDMVCERHREALWNELTPVLQGRRPPCTFGSVLRGQAGGADRAVEVSAVALREADGSVSGAILQLTDISAQKRLEAQLAQSQKLQAIGQLAGGIAHDFNNLLTAILAASDDLLARAQADADRDTLEDLRLVRTSAERGSALVRQLLAFGRPQTPQPHELAINEAVEGVASLLRRLLGSTIRLELELEQPGGTVRVDPTQLDQVLVNLAVNARDSMAQGGRLTLRTGRITLDRPLACREEVIPPGRYVTLVVQDTGCGMPSELLPRIFDPFFTTRQERGGSGLGLATVHGIIRQSDGFLAVDSTPGTGTSFRIYLPRYDGEEVTTAPEPAAGTAPASREPAAAKRTVLLVDDEDGVRRLAARALTKHGWTVLSADSGAAALALASETEIAESLCAIVSDVVMPGMDGPSLVRALRSRHPGLPAVLASGYAEITGLDGPTTEHTTFLAKPYTLKELVAALEARV